MTTINRLCPVCEAVIPADAPVSLLHGELLHKECFETTVGAQKKWRRSRPAGGPDGGGNGHGGAGQDGHDGARKG